MTQHSVVDCRNQAVGLGDIVKIIQLSPDFIASFPEEEQILISSMIGNFFKVVALDEDGYPCVMREWHDERGNPQSHVIALDSEDMEKV
ncbi:MAG: hypothetical protein ACOYNW_04220 [Undibacterium curvum]|uniref:hypothetical protein n=1 Tax=Undibacterium curvum TaxID=2762294 RepID=UPI003BD8411F